MKPSFEQAFEMIKKHEGGYVNHPNDRGGETKYGISHRAYPNLNIKNLTLDQAKAIYKRDYWDKIQGDQLPPFIAPHLFDVAVNSGVKAAITLLQRGLRIKEDGVMGPETIRAINKVEPFLLIMCFYADRIDFLTTLPSWPIHGKGWSRRVASNLRMTAQ